MTKAEYLTTVRNSGGTPEQLTREASMPISTTTGVGASSIPDIPEQTWVCVAPRPTLL
jgi:hypothetical protein